MRTQLIHLPRVYKRFILAANDFLIIELALLAAFYFRLGWWPWDIVSAYSQVFVVAPLCVLFFFYKLDLYSSITRHAGVEVMSVLARGVSFGALLVLWIFFMVPVQPQLPRSVLVLFWVLSIFGLLSSRLIAGRWLHGTNVSNLMLEFAGWKNQKKERGKPVAVYGAGSAGRQLASALRQAKRFSPLAFIDDDPALQGEVVAGLKVYSPQELPELLANMSNFEIFLALPSVGRHRRQEIIRFLEPFDVHVRSVPSLDELTQGLVNVDDIRDVDVADILGRDPVPPIRALLEKTISGRNIVVTGAGGSIGSELCRQIFKYQPAKIILVDHSEFSLYNCSSELEELMVKLGQRLELVPVIGSVIDTELLMTLFKKYEVDTVYHAAAYKHVPLVENNGYQGFINNVFGTLSLAKAAMQAGVGRVVLVSTDKAVRPTNLMGATKRLAELVLQALSRLDTVDFSGLTIVGGHSGDLPEQVVNNTRFTMVRFGNVLDSSGSVIPKFRRQIREGGPVTVTHRNVTRYFMTIPEAAELVLQANGLSEGGDVFILDMGQPVKIDDLAQKLIHLSGLSLRDDNNPDGDIEIRYTGIRPGEKLFEELLIDHKALPTEHPKIWRANERVILWPELKLLLNALEQAFKANSQIQIQELLSIPEIGYQPSPTV
ncbi:MAG: polysaccharide biosynthesis protein [Porticoccaceae bacterium]